MRRAPVPARTEVTELLQQWSDGRREALDELFPLLYRELHNLAAAQLRREFGRRSLQATELVNEAYLKLVPRRGVHLATRAQFLAIAARAMRALLVDRARARNAAKRGGPSGDAVLQVEPVSLPHGADLLDLDDALTRLASVDHRQSRIVELKYFGGLTLDEIASVLEISPATVSREWTHARAWLYAELKDGAT